MSAGEVCRSRVEPVRDPDDAEVLGWSARAACGSWALRDDRAAALAAAVEHAPECRARAFERRQRAVRLLGLPLDRQMAARRGRRG